VRHYVGQAAAGQEQQLTYLGDPEGYKAAECGAFLDYLNNNGLDALVAGLQAQPHNNARYIEQFQSLSVEDREMMGTCARLKASELIAASWDQMSVEEQDAHNKWAAEQLAEATKGKSGVSVVCPPGTPPLECKARIEKAVDAAECRGGIQVPFGPVAGCIPAPVIWGAAAVLALLIFRR
jgi:hypothetical protein